MLSQLHQRITRRKMLGMAAGGLIAGATGIGLYTWRIEPHWVRVDRVPMTFPHLSDALVGKKIVQLSDLHVGSQVDSRYLISALKLAGELKPDLTLITGDFMTSYRDEVLDKVARVLEHLEPGPLGCRAIFGNHDYGHRWSNRWVADQLASRLEKLGISVMRNTSEVIGGLQLVGLDDLWASALDTKQLFPNIDWKLPTITMCHNPDGVDLPEMSVCRGWILSGHTHGGQCKPPFLPPPLLPVRNKRYTSGKFALDSQRTLYINRALGHLRRVRFNVRPEITLFELNKSNSDATRI